MKEKYFVLGAGSALIAVFMLASLYLLGRFSVGSVTRVSDNIPTQSMPTPTIVKKAEVRGVEDSKMQDDIEKAVKDQNFVSILTYMNEVVDVRIESTGCCPPMKRINAINQLEYLKSSKGNWSFDQESETVKKLAEQSPEFYSDSIVGTTPDFYAVSFKTGDDGLIKTISMTNNYKFLLD